MSDMFVRFLKRYQVNGILKNLKLNFDVDPEPGDELHRIYAPDGDLVFSALDRGNGNFICRLHREVFDENVAFDQSKAD